MKFKILRSNFFKTLSHLQGIVDKKNSLPILSNIMIEAKTNELKNMYSEAEIKEKNEIVNLLKRIDPANSSKYQEILN